ncbi:MFS transporter [Solilutibacter silvestris]|uniref:MFS transporter n=1 Tax=Solilutibacter silvestris TaxID=1645665 RepID=UPI003D33DF58
MEQAIALTSRKTRSITITLALSTLLASLGTSIANIALPTLTEAFSAPFARVQMVVVAFLAAMTISVAIAGRLGDRLGLKRMLVAGLALFTVAAALCAVAPDLRLLIVARALQGIGAAFLMTLSMATMRQSADEARAGRAMGLLGTVSAMGTALGPSLGGLLISATGWRGIFWMQLPLAAIALLLALATLPADSDEEKSTPAKLLQVPDKRLTQNLIVNFLVAAVMMTTLVVAPFYLGLGLGLGKTSVGLVMAIGPAISVFSGIPSGRFVDIHGSRRMLGVGLVLLATGAFLLAFLPNLIGVAGYAVSIAILTPGYQLFQAANNTAALANAPKDRRGTVSGLLNLSRNTGLIAGASAMGGLFAFGTGTGDFTHAMPAAIAAGMRLTFLVAGSMMVVATAIAPPRSVILRR